MFSLSRIYLLFIRFVLHFQAYEAFKQFDKDGSNTITVAEVREACQCLDGKMSDEEVDAMVKRMDQDGNGIIDFDEFAKAWACGMWILNFLRNSGVGVCVQWELFL